MLAEVLWPKVLTSAEGSATILCLMFTGTISTFAAGGGGGFLLITGEPPTFKDLSTMAGESGLGKRLRPDTSALTVASPCVRGAPPGLKGGIIIWLTGRVGNTRRCRGGVGGLVRLGLGCRGKDQKNRQTSISL